MRESNSLLSSSLKSGSANLLTSTLSKSGMFLQRPILALEIGNPVIVAPGTFQPIISSEEIVISSFGQAFLSPKIKFRTLDVHAFTLSNKKSSDAIKTNVMAWKLSHSSSLFPSYYNFFPLLMAFGIVNKPSSSAKVF